MTVYVSTFASPAGPFSLAVDDDTAVVASAFGEIDALRDRLASRGARVPRLEADEAPTRTAREQVRAYFRGDRRDFGLPLAPHGTDFQRRVWALLREIPFGETRTYGGLARRLGTSARAVGRANATNPLVLIVPCHRVIGADGTLTGFAFGERIKRWLLDHERPAVAAIART